MSSKYTLPIALKGFLEIYSTQKLPLTFGGSLGCHNAIRIHNESNPVNGLKFNYVIPKYICCSNNNTEYVPVSTILALFDEFSSQAFIAWDKHHRPGVSLTLNAEILKHCSPGARVQFISIPRKLGNIIGFCDMKMLGEDGMLLARGSHVKYLPMGWFWNLFIGNELLMPWLVWFSRATSSGPTQSRLAAELSAGDSLGSIFKTFSISAAHPSSASPSASASASKNSVSESECGFTFLGAAHSNDMGTMHGGAIAMVAEHAAVTLVTAAAARDATADGKPEGGSVHPSAPAAVAVAMDVEYMTAVKGSGSVRVRSEWAEGGPARAEGELVRAGRPCASFRLRWASL